MGLIECPKCGLYYNDKLEACPDCGTRVHREKEEEPAKDKKSTIDPVEKARREKKRRRSTIILIAINVVGFLVFMSFGGGRAEPSDAPRVSKDYIIENATPIDYKAFARNPDDFKGKYVVAELSVTQILDGYYRCYTISSDDFYELGDEICLIDERIDDHTKILVEDVVTVYGVYRDPLIITRALTNTDEEVPTLGALYIDIQE